MTGCGDEEDTRISGGGRSSTAARTEAVNDVNSCRVRKGKLYLLLIVTSVKSNFFQIVSQSSIRLPKRSNQRNSIKPRKVESLRSLSTRKEDRTSSQASVVPS